MEALFVLSSALATDLSQEGNRINFGDWSIPTTQPRQFLAWESNRISLHLHFSFYHKQMACPWTDSLIFHIFVRAKTTVILEAAFQIDNKGHFQKKFYRHNQIQTLFNHLSETEKVLERSLRQGNLLNIASRGNRGVKDEKTIEQAWTAKTGYWTLYVLKRYHLFPRLHLSSLENRFPGTICGRSTTRCLYLMLSGSQLPFMQVLLVIPVSFFQAKSSGRNYKRLLNIQQAYLLQHWSIYRNIYLLWDSLWGEMHPTCIFYCWSSIMIRDLHNKGKRQAL